VEIFLEMINIENTGAKSHDKVLISQTFGRQTGFICGSIRFWDPKRKLPIMLLLPEDKQNFKKILNFVKKKIDQHGRLMIFLSEGYNLSNVIPVFDKSGQIMYGSSGTTSAQILSNKLNQKGIQSRIFNPTILQRVFSYNKQLLKTKDYKFAKNVGEFAAKLLLQKKKILFNWII
jgi:6-phosphofructokinase